MYRKAVIRGDTQADRANPGPGEYLKDILNKPKIYDAEGFKNRCGRTVQGSMFGSTASKEYIPGPGTYEFSGLTTAGSPPRTFYQSKQESRNLSQFLDQDVPRPKT